MRVSSQTGPIKTNTELAHGMASTKNHSDVRYTIAHHSKKQSVYCKTQTVDCRLQTLGKIQTKGKRKTTDCRLQTWGKRKTRGKMQTADCRLSLLT